VTVTRLGIPKSAASESRWQTEGRLPWGLLLRCGLPIQAKSFVVWRAGVKNAGQARRLLAIAAVLDGASRQEAAIDLRNSEISQFEETIERSTSHVCATLVETETQRARLSRSGLLSLILG
jgi:hypothetical protein